MDTNINVKTLYNSDMIKSVIEFPNNDLITHMSESIIKLQEEGVRKALIELGWTPPSKK